MSYPRNAASPPHFLVGYVYQISDGAVQTAGVSARVKTGTGSWGAAAGTLECDTTSGAWTYTPTQGETNAEAFSVSLYKASCSGVGMTVITGKSPNSGYVAPDWGQVLNASSTVSLSGTTIKAVTDGVSLGSAVITSGSFASGAITAASIAASALNGKGDWQTVIWSSPTATVNLSGTTIKAVTDSVAATVADKTGYKLASDGLAAISAWTVAITGNLTGNVSGSVGSVTGAVGSVAGNGITAASLAADASSEIAAAVRTELATELGRLDASVSSRSSHTASDVWQVGTRTLTAFSFSVTVGTIGNNVITAATLAADAGAEIASAVRSELATELARIDAATSTRSSHSAADVWAVATRTLTAFSFSVTVGTNNDKTGYSLTAGTGLGNQTADITGNLSGSVNSVTSAVTVGTNNDKTGYSLSSAAIQAIWDALTSALTTAGSIGKLLVDNINATISSRSTYAGGDTPGTTTLLSRIGSALTITGGAVTVGTNNDKTGYSLATAPLDASGTAAAVWGALLSSYTSDTTFGGRILRTDQASSGNGAKVTGAGHVAADIHELQPAVIQSTHFDLGAIDANALAADAAAEVATAVRSELATELGRIDATTSSRASQTSVDTLTTYVDTEVAAIKAKTDNLPASPAAVGDIPTAVEVADAVLGRSVATVQATAAEWSLCTLVLAALESSIVGSTWTIYRTDGTTPHATKTITTDAAAEPVTGVS